MNANNKNYSIRPLTEVILRATSQFDISLYEDSWIESRRMVRHFNYSLSECS